MNEKTRYTWLCNYGICPNYIVGEESVIVKFFDGSIGYTSPPTNYKWSLKLPNNHRIFEYCIIPYPYVTGNTIHKLQEEGKL